MSCLLQIVLQCEHWGDTHVLKIRTFCIASYYIAGFPLDGTHVKATPDPLTFPALAGVRF